MALAIGRPHGQGTTTITTAESVSISYPGFFSDLKRLGGKVEL